MKTYRFVFLGALNGKQIKKLISTTFATVLTKNQKAAWNNIISVIEKFLGNHRSENYKEIVQKTMASLKLVNVNMSLKIHFLHDHLDFFPSNCGMYTEETGERYHKDLKGFETRYLSKDVRHMLASYCWSVCRENAEDDLSRKTRKLTFCRQN